MPHQRLSKAAFAAWVGIVGNLLLAIFKGIIGFLTGSNVLLAEAANSASDVVGSIAVLIGLRVAHLPPDDDHPYGHGKAESIAAIIVSVLLILVGFQIALTAMKSLWNGAPVPGDNYSLALWIIIISVIAKELLFQYNFRLGKRLKSQALIATAWDHRSDVLSSIAALIGIVGAMIGKVYGISWMYSLDPIAGLVVSALVLRMGVKLIMESIHETMDHVLHEEETKDMADAVSEVPGVLSLDELRARQHGHYLIIDLKISVQPEISVLDGHTIGKAVKKMLVSRFAQVEDVFIHINPYDPEFPFKNDAAGTPVGTIQ
jgi:cation diffusion facilitator family transporter